MAVNDNKTQRHPVSYRPPKKLRSEFEARVKSSGMTTNAYITHHIFGSRRQRPVGTPDPNIPIKDVARLLGHVGKVGNNLNQLMRSINSGKYPPVPEVEAALVDVIELRAACLMALGKQP